ncbi:hypothetical protein XENTR_v10015947 [Xenopus tropicalis]|nr:hypothetical protein XENTR_v10015947 [Xenopus tropicalis]
MLPWFFACLCSALYTPLHEQLVKNHCGRNISSHIKGLLDMHIPAVHSVASSPPRLATVNPHGEKQKSTKHVRRLRKQRKIH